MSALRTEYPARHQFHLDALVFGGVARHVCLHALRNIGKRTLHRRIGLIFLELLARLLRLQLVWGSFRVVWSRLWSLVIFARSFAFGMPWEVQ